MYKRRTQSERTAETRAALINAAVLLLMKRGMAGATVQEICREAKVTTGSIQHHFGSKAGLMAEVVETLFTPATSIISANEQKSSLEVRISRVVDHYWSIYGGDRYYAILEVLLATRQDPALMKMVASFRKRRLDVLEVLFLRDFQDMDMLASEFRICMQRVSDYLRGHAIRRIYERSDELDAKALEAARDMALRELIERRKEMI